MSRLSRLLPPAWRRGLSAARERLLSRSLRAAADEQGLAALAARLASVAEVTGQYTTMTMDSEFLRLKVRAQHAFQVDLALGALPEDGGTVADIGDSSGTHTLYLKALAPERRLRFLSVNLDAQAVAKVQAKGLEAKRCRAEDLHREGVKADVFLLFETLEHLSDPFVFLHRLSRTGCRRLALSVPYLRRSRVGLHHIRQGLAGPVTAERVHLLELCPEDWRLVFRHAGWKAERDRVYLQYPLRSALRATKAVWASWDFEGFYGAVLTPDPSWSSQYQDWPA
ncbi:MAG: hypothetical protein HY554_09220 [Elusimicrobia bacterium]|nr:hypothetical protein [Elusimicrobiota bacterium]